MLINFLIYKQKYCYFNYKLKDAYIEEMIVYYKGPDEFSEYDFIYDNIKG